MVSDHFNIPSRGLIIEKAQPFLRQDIDLVKLVLREHDEVVVCVGSAGTSHEIGQVMTAGERVELVDLVLQNEGVDPKKYIIIPVENSFETSNWVADVMMLTPKWDVFYTRNFRNASMFASFKHQFGYEVSTVDEQKPDVDFFQAIANQCKGVKVDVDVLSHVPDFAMCIMEVLGVIDRCDVMYNRVNVPFIGSCKEVNRAFFLGGLQPLTGVYSDGTGHLGVIKKGLEDKGSLVIAVGSAQMSHTESDPLTAGKRIEVIRHALISNGVSPSNFYIIPVKDISSNAGYAAKVVSLCPSFDSVLAGNDWTKQLFGEGKYEIISLSRSSYSGSSSHLSASLVRKTVKDAIMQKSDSGVLSADSIVEAETRLTGMVDPASLQALRSVGFYDVMNFLSYAKE